MNISTTCIQGMTSKQYIGHLTYNSTEMFFNSVYNREDEEINTSMVVGIKQNKLI